MELVLRNLMEDIVIHRLDELLPKLDCCQCNQCRLDIASYALNRLPAKYVVTTQGELLSKLDTFSTQFEASVTTQITQASIQIKNSPRHNNTK